MFCCVSSFLISMMFRLLPVVYLLLVLFFALNDLRLFPHYAAEEFENSSETCIKCFASTLRNRN